MRIAVLARFVVALSIFAIASSAHAATFYVSSSTGNDHNTGRSSASPWATLHKVFTSGQGAVAPGDSILFLRGDTFTATGGDSWYTPGTAGHPISFGAYGMGAKPVFQFPTSSALAVSDRAIFAINAGTSYISIDNINFTDLTIAASPSMVADKNMFANAGYGIDVYANGSTRTVGIDISNCDFSLIGQGIAFESADQSSITNCTFVNLKNIVNTATPDYDDYGANGISISGDDNIVSRNYFEGTWCDSLDFQYSGGAVEMFQAASRNLITYNIVIDGGGLAEFGSTTHTDLAADNVFAYNLLIDSGMLTWLNTSSTFAINVSNVHYYNNTIVSTPSDRFVTTPGIGQTLYAFDFSASHPPSAATAFDIENNIFYLSSGISVVSPSAVLAKYIFKNNVYHLAGGSALHHPLDPSEISTNMPIFVSTTASDDTMWDYHLVAGSPAIAAGRALGFMTDFDGHAVGSPPCAGIFEYVPVVVSDAGMPDAGLADAGVMDSGTMDAGTPDMGVVAMDSGPRDMGVVMVDSGPPDMGIAVIDSGPPDMGVVVPDLGAPDMGAMIDAGVDLGRGDSGPWIDGSMDDAGTGDANTPSDGEVTDATAHEDANVGDAAILVDASTDSAVAPHDAAASTDAEMTDDGGPMWTTHPIAGGCACSTASHRGTTPTPLSASSAASLVALAALRRRRRARP